MIRRGVKIGGVRKKGDNEKVTLNIYKSIIFYSTSGKKG
jgi:hypothetical protein